MSNSKFTSSDRIEFELFKNALQSIADEMAFTIVRTSYSGVLRDNMDFSTALADSNGKLVAQGLTLPGHLGSMPTAFDAVLEKFGDSINPKDIFVLNDPFNGGMHLPDIFLFQPIFVDDVLMAFAATVCHHIDVGGRVPGSNASDSTEIYQEGFRIPPLKLFDRGKPNEAIFTLLTHNVRLPVKLMGDIRSQLAACKQAERQIIELVGRYGTDGVQRYFQETIEYSERLMRAALLELPDGEFSFEDFVDDDGIDFGKRIRLHVVIKKSGDKISADWSGSSAQVKGAINSTLSCTQAATYTSIRSVLNADIPNNEGVFRVIEVTATEGSITNAILPAACAARGLLGFRMVDCCLGALAKMVPDRVPAASDGGNTGITIGGYRETGEPFIFVDFACGTWGGRPWADGLQANAHVFANMASQSAEVIEAENPVEILAIEFVQDRAGPGQYRGGAPYRRIYRFTETESVLQVRSDRRHIRPFGLYGGGPGKSSKNFINDGTENRLVTSKFTMNVRRGDVFTHELAGGGGWGDPLLRDASKVQDDVRNEYVSIAAAARDYGVIIDPDTLVVDFEATEETRKQIRDRRSWEDIPFVLFEDPVDTEGLLQDNECSASLKG